MKHLSQHITEAFQNNAAVTSAFQELHNIFRTEMSHGVQKSLVDSFIFDQSKLSGHKHGISVWAGGSKWAVSGESIKEVEKELEEGRNKLKSIRSKIEDIVKKFDGMFDVKFEPIDKSKIVEIFDREQIGRYWGSTEVPILRFTITVAKKIASAKTTAKVENEIRITDLVKFSNVSIVTTRHRETANREINAIILDNSPSDIRLYDVEKNHVYTIKSTQVKSISLLSQLNVAKNASAFDKLYGSLWAKFKTGDTVKALSKRYSKSTEPELYVIEYMNLDKIVLKNVNGPGSLTVDYSSQFHVLQKA